MLRSIPKPLARALAVLPLLLLCAWSRAHAGTGGSDLPFNKPLQTIQENFTGPTGKIIAICAVGAAGIAWFAGHNNEGYKTAIKVVIGIAILLSAPTLIDTLGIQGSVF
jgi:type IV secretory pathway VirB2 component (pilin)